jgi:hypothetical protein
MAKRAGSRGVGVLVLFAGVFLVLTGLVDGFSGERGRALLLAGGGLALLLAGGTVLGALMPDLDDDAASRCPGCGRQRDRHDRFCAACGSALP